MPGTWPLPGAPPGLWRSLSPLAGLQAAGVASATLSSHPSRGEKRWFAGGRASPGPLLIPVDVGTNRITLDFYGKASASVHSSLE